MEVNLRLQSTKPKLRAPNRMVAAAAEVSGTQVLENIDKVSQYMTNHTETLPDSLYKAMNGFSKTFLAYKDTDGKDGWADTLTTQEGEKVWSPEQVQQLKEAFGAMTTQSGGAFSNIQLGAQSSLIKSTEPNQFSLDAIYESAKGYLSALDEKNRELAQAIGPVAYVQTDKDPKFGPYPPFVPFQVPIPNRMILPAMNALLETLRLLVSSTFYNNDFLRKVLSIVLGIFDVLRGNWRDGILSLLGVYSRNAMFAGMIGKLALWVYMFISPDIRGRLSDDVWAASKSMVVGSWLWIFSVVSPDFVREYVNSLFGTVQARADELNQKITAIEEVAQASVQGQGLVVQFPRFPLTSVPSYDDIQNFQALIHRPEVFCSEAVQNAIQPLLAMAPFRVALELLNVPTLPEKRQEVCKNIPTTVTAALTQSLSPTVTPEQPFPTAPKEDEDVQEQVPKEEVKEKEEQEVKEKEPKEEEVKVEVVANQEPTLQTNKPPKTRKQKGGVRRTRRVMRLF